MRDLPDELHCSLVFHFEDPSFDHLWRDLTSLKPCDVAFNAGVDVIDGGYKIKLIGADYLLDVVGQKVFGPLDRPIPDQRLILTLIYYLLGAKPACPANTKLVPETVLQGGDRFFSGGHALNRKPLLNAFANNGEKLLEKAEALGARRIDNDAGSFSFGITLLPKVFAQITLCEADDEFDADLFFAFDPTVTEHVELPILSSLISLLNELLTLNS